MTGTVTTAEIEAAKNRARDRVRAIAELFDRIERGDYIEFDLGDGVGRRLLFVLEKYPVSRELFGQVLTVGAGLAGERRHIDAEYVVGFWPTDAHHRGGPRFQSSKREGGQSRRPSPREPMRAGRGKVAS